MFLARPEDAEPIAIVHVRSWQGAYACVMPRDLLDGLDVPARTGLWQRVPREAGQPGTGVVVAESGADLQAASVSGGCRQVGLLPGGLVVFAEAAEQVGEVAGGELPVKWPCSGVVAVDEGHQGAEPSGSAVLFQEIYAEDYRSGTVTFRGQLRTSGVVGQAGMEMTFGPGSAVASAAP